MLISSYQIGIVFASIAHLSFHLWCLGRTSISQISYSLFVRSLLKPRPCLAYGCFHAQYFRWSSYSMGWLQLDWNCKAKTTTSTCWQTSSCSRHCCKACWNTCRCLTSWSSSLQQRLCRISNSQLVWLCRAQCGLFHGEACSLDASTSCQSKTFQTYASICSSQRLACGGLWTSCSQRIQGPTCLCSSGSCQFRGLGSSSSPWNCSQISLTRQTSNRHFLVSSWLLSSSACCQLALAAWADCSWFSYAGSCTSEFDGLFLKAWISIHFVQNWNQTDGFRDVAVRLE